MLRRVRLTNFKSFVDEEVELAPLTLLVGANASGKSNFLDALRFLQGVSYGFSLSEILDGERRGGMERWPPLRGGSAEAARVGTSSFAIESTWRVPASVTPPASGISAMGDLTHRIACRVKPSVKLEAERLTVSGVERPLIDADAAENGHLRTTFAGNGDKAPATLLMSAESTSLLHQVKSDPRLTSNSLVKDHAFCAWKAMERLTFLDVAPSSMRDLSRKDRHLNLDARNISGVLAQLCEEADEKRILVDWLSELCAPELSDIDFIEVKELGAFMAVLVEKGGARIPARSLSDGTLRFLGLLVALRAAGPGDVFLIEEIDAGLHPTRVRVLVEFLVDVAHRKGVQVIATTHSPVVLEWLKSFSEAALRSAIVFGRIPEHEGTVMRCLGDLPHFDEIVARKRIDELFSTGWLERAL